MNNPYTSRGPLHDARMFFGRKDYLDEIAAFIRGNQSVSIVGPPKFGKSSLMLHLMRAETIAALGIGVENLFVYIDCEDLSGCSKEEIYTCFCTGIATELLKHTLAPEPALKTVISNPTWSAFEVALHRLKQRGLRVVLMLDEFEQLKLNTQVTLSFYNALRSAAGRQHLIFLTGSSQPLIELANFDSSMKNLSSPFFNIFAQVFLGLLSETEARDVIRKPMEAAGIAVSLQLEDFIYQLVGGHPLALQLACFHAWENPDDLSRIELCTLQELDEHFQYYWRNLNPVERDVLCHLTEAGLQETGNPNLMIALRDLTQKCLLMKTGGSYRYPSKAWAEFISAHLEPVIILPNLNTSN